VAVLKKFGGAVPAPHTKLEMKAFTYTGITGRTFRQLLCSAH